MGAEKQKEKEQRQRDIIFHLAMGYTAEETADRLKINKSTINADINTIKQLHGAKNGANLVHLLHLNGYFNSPIPTDTQTTE